MIPLPHLGQNCLTRDPADCKPLHNAEVSRDGVGLRQYRVARWFLLPEAELRPRQGSRLQICHNPAATFDEISLYLKPNMTLI